MLLSLLLYSVLPRRSVLLTMNPQYPSSSSTYAPSHTSQSEMDPLDEFLSPLLVDLPDIPPMPVSALPSSSSSASIPAPSAAALAPSSVSSASASTAARTLTPTFLAPHPQAHAHAHAHTQATPLPTLACQWISRRDLPFICGVHLPADAKHACAHFRMAHNVRGNDKAIVSCQWQGCHAPPMQRGSVIRHLLAVHLGLLRWQCEVCGRMFSRKGTGHLCDGEAEEGE